MNKRDAIAAASAGAAVWALWPRIVCWWCGHIPRRVYLGLFQCQRCDRRGADLGEFGDGEDAYVSPGWKEPA